MGQELSATTTGTSPSRVLLSRDEDRSPKKRVSSHKSVQSVSFLDRRTLSDSSSNVSPHTRLYRSAKLAPKTGPSPQRAFGSLSSYYERLETRATSNHRTPPLQRSRTPLPQLAEDPELGSPPSPAVLHPRTDRVRSEVLQAQGDRGRNPDKSASNLLLSTLKLTADSQRTQDDSGCLSA